MNIVEENMNESTQNAIAFEMNQEHEIRFYLKQIKAIMNPAEDEEFEAFKPKYLVTAVKLPTGSIELAVNTESISEKIDYILEAYDYAMRLKTNPEIEMQNIMVV